MIRENFYFKSYHENIFWTFEIPTPTLWAEAFCQIEDKIQCTHLLRAPLEKNIFTVKEYHKNRCHLHIFLRDGCNTNASQLKPLFLFILLYKVQASF